MKGFRNKIKSFFLGHRNVAPVIITPFGPVTEFARQTAAMNMKSDPELKRQVEEMLAKELGSAARGLAEAKRRYPECYRDDH